MEIHGYPNYLIYEDGRVRSKRFENRFLKQQTTRDGYKNVGLYGDNGKTTELIHRLMAKTYIPNPLNLETVDHINRIRDDNRVENLRWASRKQQAENRIVIRYNPRMTIRFRTDRRNKPYLIRTEKICKSFETKTDALCYKYIHKLRVKAGHYG